MPPTQPPPHLKRRYYLQNWRADVVAITKSDGNPLEYVFYSAYGEATVHPIADVDMDGDVDSADATAWDNGDNLGAGYNYHPAGSNLNWDDKADAADDALFDESYAANVGLSGRGRMSSVGVGNRKGYAGYEHDESISMYHVRHRVYRPDLGRWMTRDPLGYVDGMNVYEYVAGRVLAATDSKGLCGNDDSSFRMVKWHHGPLREYFPVEVEFIEDYCPGLLNDPEIAASAKELRRVCPKLKLSFKRTRGEFGNGVFLPERRRCRGTITIETPDMNDFDPSSPYDSNLACVELKETLLHELRHAYQACAVYAMCESKYFEFWPAWTDEDNSICAELDAYCTDPTSPDDCRSGIRPAARTLMCSKACRSLTHIPSCLTKCQSIYQKCVNGIKLFQ